MMHQTRRVLLAVTAVASLLVPRALASHEIPERVTLRGWVLPRGDSLTLLLRVPLEAMRDLDFPERADGSLDLTRVRAMLPDAARTWVASAVRLFADGEALAQATVSGARIALPDDRGFYDAAAAAAVFTAPALGDSVHIPWRQALVDVALTFALPAPDAHLVLDAQLARLGVRTNTVLHIVTRDGDVRTLAYLGDPGRIPLEPRWWENAGRFLREGFWHILGGIDHLLFVLCLVLPLRRIRPLVAVVTAFTVAHSITLGAAALGVAPTALWFPPLVESLIALSILWLTVENILLPAERLEGRWRTAFVLGLVHGFGFSFALGEQLQFAGRGLVVALAGFNVGVELGQLAVLVAALPLLVWLRRLVPDERQHLVTWVGSAFIAHTAYHWAAERVGDLRAYEIAWRWPTFDATFALHAIQALLVAAIALAAALGLRQLYTRLLRT